MENQRKTFLSYSRVNKDFALRLAKELKAEGFYVWLDQLDIPAGARWDREVEKALKECEIFMIIITQASTESENVLDEIGYAIDKGKRILPVLLENCEIPLRLRRFQYADFTGASFDEGLESAKRLLRDLVGQTIIVRADTSQTQVEEERKNIEEEERLLREADADLADRLRKEEEEGQEKARIESERKKREEADRLAAKKSEEERKKKEKEERVAIKASQKKPVSRGIIAGVSAVVLLVIAVLGINAFKGAKGSGSEQTPSATQTFTPMPTLTLAPLKSKYKAGSALTGRDGMTMLYVPTGDFTMGSDSFIDDSKPAHKVYINGFWIDKTEVSNQMYSSCVQDGACNPPGGMDSSTRSSYYGNPEYKFYPVIYVSWDDAKTYCKWAGRRLPTEAEWEKAARGTDGRVYPWGNNDPTSLFLNFNGLLRDTSKVDSFSKGASFYGALNMAGNVWEWVADWYDSVYYRSSPTSNPLGSDMGSFRVRRGGSWDDYLGGDDVRSTYRDKGVPSSTSLNNVGIRCARSE
jgi:formylglycine-generating enzyme required for sulfatase activity